MVSAPKISKGSGPKMAPGMSSIFLSPQLFWPMELVKEKKMKRKNSVRPHLISLVTKLAGAYCLGLDWVRWLFCFAALQMQCSDHHQSCSCCSNLPHRAQQYT